MNNYICQQTFTSPNTGKTYLAKQEITKYEYERLSYSDSRRFLLKENQQTFAYQSSQKNSGISSLLTGQIPKVNLTDEEYPAY